MGRNIKKKKMGITNNNETNEKLDCKTAINKKINDLLNFFADNNNEDIKEEYIPFDNRILDDLKLSVSNKARNQKFSGNKKSMLRKESIKEESINIGYELKCAMINEISFHTRNIKKLAMDYRLNIQKLSDDNYKKLFKFSNKCKICNVSYDEGDEMIKHVICDHLKIRNCSLFKCFACAKENYHLESFLEFYKISQHYANFHQFSGENFTNNFVQTENNEEICIYIDGSCDYNILIDYQETFDLCFTIPEHIVTND
ncbi:Hypothetical protein SRAE_X000163700 [Strongyloides ratti]|uniref:C2H2-type domain-containing protein n=1 Tax=Strongyloides ratti TaxID=34506 RepID=A0A090KR92_STRRB|nr:Hypothetical protein SRAE_X000163700 [Strongyloides ratti]CEF59894.1 Hypothetical protein SRAE_X000163700 [Strongyloides ratti]